MGVSVNILYLCTSLVNPYEIFRQILYFKKIKMNPILHTLEGFTGISRGNPKPSPNKVGGVLYFFFFCIPARNSKRNYWVSPPYSGESLHGLDWIFFLFFNYFLHIFTYSFYFFYFHSITALLLLKLFINVL